MLGGHGSLDDLRRPEQQRRWDRERENLGPVRGTLVPRTPAAQRPRLPSWRTNKDLARPDVSESSTWPRTPDRAEAPLIQAVNSDEEIAWITVETSRAINQIRARRSRTVHDAIQGENRRRGASRRGSAALRGAPGRTVHRPRPALGIVLLSGLDYTLVATGVEGVRQSDIHDDARKRTGVA